MRRGLAGLALAVLLTGCADLPDGAQDNAPRGFLAGLAPPQDGGARSNRKPPLLRAELVGGDVIVAGPEGYCIDRATLKRRPDSGFAVLASCRILSGGTGGPYVDPMMVTITVGPQSDAALPTPDGLAIASDAGLLSSAAEPDLVLAQMDRGGRAVLSDGDPRYWRGVFRVGPRLISLALYAPRNSALAADEGARMLRQVKGRIVTLSAGSGENRAGRSAGGLIGRLFKSRNLP